MATKVPLVKQEIVWLAIVPRLILIAVFCIIFFQFDKRNFFIYGFLLYLVFSFSIKYILIPRSTYKSVKLIKQEEFEKAIPYIQKDIDYYSRKLWIDNFRFVFMISSSKRSFREMSLCNMAYCLMQIGKVNQSKDLYEFILSQYPDSNVARSVLNNINLIVANFVQTDDTV